MSGHHSWFYLASACLLSGVARATLGTAAQEVWKEHGVILHDPSDLLGRSLWEDDREKIIQLLVAFKRKMTGSHLSQWAVHGGLALLDSTSGSEASQQLAEDLGLNDTQDQKSTVLVLLSDLGVELAGSLFATSNQDHVLLESAEWLAAEELCNFQFRAGKMALAAQAAFDGLLRVLTGSTELVLPQSSFKQQQLWKFTSPYQEGEVFATLVWQNICGDRLCRELVLGDVRQLSDVFERYYHEAMTFPALNLLGMAKRRRVLILGGGDGGIATCSLQFDTVEKVVNVDIDAAVSEAARRWFPQVSRGFEDPRCELVHADAFAWVEGRRDETFDLVIIDFTDEPIEGAWSEEFFSRVRGVLSDDGIVVQNVGTMATPEDLHKLFRLHRQAFASVFPLHALIPDYLGPYILVLSSLDPDLQPLAVDWDSWRRQKIPVQYYGPDQHMALFTPPADVMQLLGLQEEAMPSKIPPLGPIPSSKALQEKAIWKEKSTEGHKVKVTLENSYSLYQAWDPILSPTSWQRDEALILPALSILGDTAKSVLILGGGTGALASLALSWPAVQRVVVLEVDESVVWAVRKYFPTEAKALSDPRTELIMADAFKWISSTEEKFDLVILSMFDQPWLPARRTSRMPQVRGFYRQLRALMTPHGLLAQEAGSLGMPQAFGSLLELHRQIFRRTWPLAMGSAMLWPTGPEDDFDGLYFRVPRLLLLSSREEVDPMKVDWHHWRGFLEARGSKMTYYHPALHRALFVLPAELQRRFQTAPPWREEAQDEFLIHSFMTQVRGCSALLLNEIQVAGSLLKNLAALADLTALGSLGHNFEPQGLTALLLVSESHLSIHTWPELHYAAVDVVSCKAITKSVRKQIEAEVARSLGCNTSVSHFARRGRGFNQVDSFGMSPLQPEAARTDL